jgi:predicted Zn finger-like uncharacterized protein
VVITCEKCTTRFQLPDERIPAAGAKVRCSRCRHAFFVKPGAPAGDPVEAAVSRAVSEHAEPELDAPASGPVGLRDEETDEGAWKFDNELEAPVDEQLEAAREAVDDLLRGSSGVRAPDPFEPDPEVDGDLDALLTSGRAETDTIGPMTARGATDDLFGDPTAGVGEPEPAAEPAELGQPEDWDLLGGEVAPEPASPAPAPMKVTIGRLGEVAAGAGRLSAESDSESPAVIVWLGRSAEGVGWAACALLVAGVLWASLAPRPAPELVTRAVVAGLEATGVEGHWIDNAVVGPIYVISGNLGSAGTEPVRPGAQIAVQLLDGAGQGVGQPAAMVGSPLPEAWLRERPPSELRALHEQSSRAWADATFTSRPGSRFHAVLARVPAGARRFAFVAVPLAPLPPEPAAPAPEASAPATPPAT